MARTWIYFVITVVTVQNAAMQDSRPENSRLNYFDIDLLRYSAEDMKGNVMVSPASIKSTLAMILEGSAGATAEEIRSALRLSSNKEEFREQLNTYLSLLQANTSSTTLKNANSVFVSHKLKLKKDYDMMLRKVYFSEICPINFMDPITSSAEINGWVSNVTRGLIPTITDPVHINPSTDILLVNALYFKSSWKHAFDPRSTRSGCFYHHNVCRNVAMMELHAELNYAYVDNLRAHAVELPYDDSRYSMIILVPQERDGMTSLIRDLPYMSLPQISSLFEPADVMLTLPKFQVDYSEDMVPALQAMRIKTVFSKLANLSGIFEGDLPQINNMFHKVHMSVDETGTVAAAATAAMVIPLIENGINLRVDRPFVFFIRDNKLGLVLFEGKIEEPSAYAQTNGLSDAAARKTAKSTGKPLGNRLRFSG